MGGTAVGNDSTVTEATSKQLSGDVTLPPGAVIKQQDTLVMSATNTWMGRISLSVSGEPQAVFAYFRDTMQGTNFGGNEVLITVAPAVRAGSARP